MEKFLLEQPVVTSRDGQMKGDGKERWRKEGRHKGNEEVVEVCRQTKSALELPSDCCIRVRH